MYFNDSQSLLLHTNLSEIRGILKEVSFGDQYNFEKDHDVDYIIFAIHAL